MDENPYQAPLSEPERRSRLIAAWSSTTVCAVAIFAPAVVGAIAMLLFVPTYTGTIISLMLAAWTIVVLGLNEISRRSA